MKIIGLTGGIGSGKSTVAKAFEVLGAKLFIADTEANIITAVHPLAVKQISDAFGAGVYHNGQLDRRALAAVVFSDPGKLQLLNSIVHPLVKEAFDRFAEKNASAPYIIMESAILVQSGFYRFTDFSVLVTAPEEVRIQRVMERNHISVEEVRHRISSQISDAENKPYCEFEIENSGKMLILPQIEKIWNANL